MTESTSSSSWGGSPTSFLTRNTCSLQILEESILINKLASCIAAHMHMDQTHLHMAVAIYGDVLHVYNIAIPDIDACMCMCDRTHVWDAVSVKIPHHTDDSIPTQTI